MRKLASRSTQVVIDLAVLSAAYWLAFMLRFDWVVPEQMWKRLLFTWPYVIAFQYALLVAFGVTRFAWRYIGLREAIRIALSTGAAAVLLLAARFASAAILPKYGHAQYTLVPIGIIMMDFAGAFMGTAGIRGLRRWLAEREESVGRKSTSPIRQVKTMLVGAGQAGLVVAKELAARPDLGIVPVGFLDDDSYKVGSEVHGIRVLGKTADLAKLCAERGAEEVLITIASAAGKEIRRIRQLCEQAGLPVKIIPGIFEIVGGQVNLSRIRSVAIEDLLGREPVVLEEASIAAALRGRTVLVTGAGGSIGSELCRQICRFEPGTLVLVERAENSLFFIERELRGRLPDCRLIPCIADVTDVGRMSGILREHAPSMILHAAAHKHVPMMEWNPGEAVKNNVGGTRCLADLADAHRVDRFVMISTDKAVNPSSVMGASKRVAEMYVQSLSQRSQTRFVTVRFGNVLGSAGSVIPTFQEQIARGGPVTVTHPEMKRYFMTIPEACQLVLQSAVLGKGGEIFILDMGEPVKIADLARDLIELSGLKPGEDIEIRYTGLRPGEKLFEELSVAEEHAEKTSHPNIYVGRLRPGDWEEISTKVGALVKAAEAGADDIKDRLGEVVPEYRAEAASEAPGASKAAAPTVKVGVA